MNYPNLKELIECHPYTIETFASHANVTIKVLKAAFDGKEELTQSELYGIVKLTGFPYNALIYPKLILMDNRRYRHRMMARKGNDKLRSIIKAAEAGSSKAIGFVECHYWNYGDGTTPFWTDFINDVPVSYARYWCGNWKLNKCLKEIEDEKCARPVRDLIGEISVSDESTSKKSVYLTKFLKSVDELQCFAAAHGNNGIVWDVFQNLSCLIGEYMMESRSRGTEGKP